MSAIGYVTIGAINGKISGEFYDAVFSALGSERKFDKGGWLGYGVIGAGKSFMDCHTAVCPPFDGNKAHAGNGIMIAYAAKSTEAVKAAHAAGFASSAHFSTAFRDMFGMMPSDLLKTLQRVDA